MATRRNKAGVRNRFRFVLWEVPLKRSSEGFPHMESEVMALPTSGTPVDEWEWARARAAKKSLVKPEQVLILRLDEVDNVS